MHARVRVCHALLEECFSDLEVHIVVCGNAGSDAAGLGWGL